MVMYSSLCYQLEVPYDFEQSVKLVTMALEEEGFGILTKIDAKEVFQEKLGVNFRQYLILGACNPALSFKAIDSDHRAGILLPCNVIVEEAEKFCLVTITNPEKLFSLPPFTDNPGIEEMTADARSRIEKVVMVLERVPNKISV
jgi:uncharacterized protein (DUF302 family)